MTLIGIPGRDSASEYSRFVRRFGLGQMPQLPSENGDLWEKFGVSYQPRWILIRADGTVDRGAGGIPNNIVEDALTAG